MSSKVATINFKIKFNKRRTIQMVKVTKISKLNNKISHTNGSFNI